MCNSVPFFSLVDSDTCMMMEPSSLGDPHLEPPFVFGEMEFG
jgi:hypothetical protein